MLLGRDTLGQESESHHIAPSTHFRAGESRSAERSKRPSLHVLPMPYPGHETTMPPSKNRPVGGERHPQLTRRIGADQVARVLYRGVPLLASITSNSSCTEDHRPHGHSLRDRTPDNGCVSDIRVVRMDRPCPCERERQLRSARR